jgi:hypothetical protein
MRVSSIFVWAHTNCKAKQEKFLLCWTSFISLLPVSLFSSVWKWKISSSHSLMSTHLDTSIMQKTTGLQLYIINTEYNKKAYSALHWRKKKYHTRCNIYCEGMKIVILDVKLFRNKIEISEREGSTQLSMKAKDMEKTHTQKKRSFHYPCPKIKLLWHKAYIV